MDRQLLIDAVIAEARSYLGVKWRHRGRSRHGIDCIGLVVLSLRAAGIDVTDEIGYSRTPWKYGLDAHLQARFGDAVADDMRPGDIVTLCAPGQPEPGHVGIVASRDDRLTLIHSYAALANSVVVEHGIDADWQRRIHTIYRPIP